MLALKKEMTMLSILTQYRIDQRGGPGFYNFLEYNQACSSGQMAYGPYASRPLANIAAAALRHDMSSFDSEVAA